MSKEIEKSTFLVKSNENNSFGTAFCIYKDRNGSYLLTCAHVVNTCNPESLVVISNNNKSLEIKVTVKFISKDYELIDLAVLYVEGLIENEALTLSIEEVKVNEHFNISGFRHHRLEEYAQEPINGSIKKIYPIVSKSKKNVLNYDLKIFNDDNIEPGYSGSAIVVKNKVVAVVTSRKGANQAYAIPIKYLEDIWEDMPKELLSNEKTKNDNKVVIENTNFKPKVFISYSHEDEEWKDLIRKYFDASELFDMWDDRDIELGKDWANEIDKAAIEADIAVLLISVDFLNSSFIKNKEVPMLLNRESNIKIIPILLSSAPWKQHDWLAKLQGYPKNFTALDSFKVDNNIPFKKCPNVSREINNFVDKIYREYRSSFLNNVSIDNQVVVEESENKLLDSLLDKEEQYKVNINNVNIIRDNEKLGTITIKTVPIEVEGKVLNISIYPVTNNKYKLYCEYIDKTWIYLEGREDYPVVNISYTDAINYCKWLSTISNKNYRLLSSIEWESIAKNNIPKTNYNDLLNYIWCQENSNRRISKVGQKEKGLMGIYDFNGNINEFCSNKVLKGGSFDDDLNTICNLERTLPIFSNKKNGFRVVEESL